MHIDLQLELVYQDPYLKVEVDKNVNFIFLEWLQTPDTEGFRKSFKAAASIAVELDVEYWLSDARAIPYLDFSDQNWIIREMMPLLHNARLKRYARLSSKESIGLLDIHRIFTSISTEHHLNIQAKFETFANKDSAEEWLFSEYKQDQSSSTQE